MTKDETILEIQKLLASFTQTAKQIDTQAFDLVKSLRKEEDAIELQKLGIGQKQ